MQKHRQQPESPGSHYVPALGHHWLTPFYDPIIALTTREGLFRQELLQQIHAAPGSMILDLACGTGSQALMLADQLPDSEIWGLDADTTALNRARKKADAKGLKINFQQGLSFNLPYPDEQFDQVVTSLFFHHLNRIDKTRTLSETLRVLKPGGKIACCDWGKPSNIYAKLAFNIVRLIDGMEVTRDNVLGNLPSLIRAAGFSGVIINSRISTALGTLDIITANKQGASHF